MRPSLAAYALLLLVPFATPAHAAESYDSCSGTITSLPTTITTQGTWCLKADLATTIASGSAITVNTNNVTIDCNGFKLGNLGAGMSTQTVGIRAVARAGVTVRGCNLRGFKTAIDVDGSGHLIEDNRIEASRTGAIRLSGDYMVVRRNIIIDTGGQNGLPIVIYFAGATDVRDNIIDGVFPVDADDVPLSVRGIQSATPTHYTIRGNVIRGMTTLGNGGVIRGLDLWIGDGDVIDNTLSAVPGAATSYAIDCEGGDGFVRNNRASGFEFLAVGCPPELTGNELRN